MNPGYLKAVVVLSVCLTIAFSAGRLSRSPPPAATPTASTLPVATSEARPSVSSSTAEGDAAISTDSGTNTKGIIEQLKRTPGHLDWYARASGWLGQASEEELTAALLQSERLPDWDLRQTFRSLAFERWGQLNGPAALAYLETLPRGEFPNRAWMVRIFDGWVSKDPTGAIQGAITSGCGQKTVDYVSDEKMLQRIFATLGESDAELATALAVDLAQTPQRREESNSALSGLAEWQYAQGGVSALLNWRSQLPAGVSADTALATAAAAALKHKDIQGASEIIGEVGLANVDRTTVREFAEGLASLNRQGAVDWVIGIPPGEAREYAFRGLLGASWRDEELGWLSRFPAGPETDALLIQDVDGTEEFMPERNLKIASFIADPEARNRLMQTSALAWLKQSPEDAIKVLPPQFAEWWNHRQQRNAEDRPPNF